MEEATYGGKKYRKLKSLAPVRVLKDIKTECEQDNFVRYLRRFGPQSTPSLVDIVCHVRGGCGNTMQDTGWLPWLIQKGYIEEVSDERNEHRAVFKKFLRDQVLDPCGV